MAWSPHVSMYLRSQIYYYIIKSDKSQFDFDNVHTVHGPPTRLLCLHKQFKISARKQTNLELVNHLKSVTFFSCAYVALR